MQENKQHVQVPTMMGVKIEKDSEDKTKIVVTLKPFDKLVYAFMKRSMDKNTKRTYVSIETIAKDLNVNRKTVNTSIKKLCDCGAIKKLTQKIGRSNLYEFLPNEKFEMFTYDFLNDCDKLTTDEKAIVLSMQEYTYKDPDTGDGYTTYDITSLARMLNLSLPTLRKTFCSLESKDIMTSSLCKSIDKNGSHKILRRIDNNQIAQAILFIGKQVVENTNDITELKRAMQEMRVELNQTKSELQACKTENEVLKQHCGYKPKTQKEYSFEPKEGA